MNEYSRIIIETYCDKYKTDSRLKMLAKLVKRSYKIDAEYESDAEANFIFDAFNDVPRGTVLRIPQLVNAIDKYTK